MTKSSPAATDHWAVSTRTQGGVLTAGAALPSIELALLGIPGGFTPAEIQSWLRDLGGVAIETSRTDERTRPIPQLLHHALTGLLFSQTELWSHTGQPLPCAAVFVHGPQGVAFGWVGRARVVLLVNGEPHEPQWVIVRDEAGQEAMSAALPADSHVLLTLEYWPDGEDATQAPASLDAEWGQSFANLANAPSVVPQPAPQPAVVVPAEPPARRAARTLESITKSVAGLPTEQPGLAPDPSGVPLDEPDAAQVLPSTRHPSSGTFAMPTVPALASAASDLSIETSSAPVPTFDPAPDPTATTETGHPVGRWLSKVIGFARRAVPRIGERTPDPLEPFPRSRPSSISPAPAPLLESGHEPVAESPRLVLASELAPTEAIAPPPAVFTPNVLDTPHGAAVPVAAERPAATRALSGLAAAGIEEILGKRAANRPSGATRVEGLTAPGSPSTSRPATSTMATPDALRSPYPKLEVTPVAPPARGGMQIEREPVGADTTFAIPRLPTLTAPKPSKIVVPTAADMMRRDAEEAAKRAASAPPALAKPEAPTPSVAPVVALAPEAVVATPAPAEPASEPEAAVKVPEPPAEFLAEFAASMVESPPVPAPDLVEAGSAAPIASAPAPPPTVQEASAPAPPPLPEPVAGALAPPAFESPEATADPVIPRGVSIMMRRPNFPPQLASSMRAAAVSAPTPPAPPPPASPVEGAPVLRTPTRAEPVPVAESEMPTMLRELPLSAPEPETAADEIPEGMLVAQPSTVTRAFRSTARGAWPDLEDDEPRGVPFWRNPWIVIPVIAVLFGGGWLVGHSQAPDNDIHATPMSRVLRTVGLGGARFTAIVDTDPPGAFIAVDGKPISRRTPSTIELPPGSHTVTLSMPDLGEVVVPIKGSARQKVTVTEALHGSLEVSALDPSLPVKMSLDGEPKGFLPVQVEKLPPGLHEVQFSGPNMQPWGQTVNIGIRQKSTVKARPMMSPATGVVQVQASLNDEGGTAPLSGAAVYVDGDMRGTTPLTLELPRGPHSLRVTFRGETAPVQVIDLPGGNKRFASFQFGLDSDLPPLKLQAGYAQLSSKRSTLVEASLAGLDWRDVREAWLHVRTGEGMWRRYQMTIGEGPNGALLSVDFPTNAFDAQGRVTWYMSAATTQGDEFHTEIQRSTR